MTRSLWFVISSLGLGCAFPVVNLAAAERPVGALPAHLQASGIPTQTEVDMVGAWLKAITADQQGRSSGDAWFDHWIGTGLPFGLQYGGREFSLLADRWQSSRQGPTREGTVQTDELSWMDPQTGLKAIWHIKRLLDLPAVDFLLTLENTGRKDTPLITNLDSLRLDMNHSHPEKTYTVHGAWGGRCGRDDLMAFSLPVPDAASVDAGPALLLLRQDYEQLEVGKSILKTPLVIGKRTFEHGLGTHSVSQIQIRSPQPIARFTAWVGVDHNERTRGGAGSVVFSVSTEQGQLFRSGVLRGGQEPVRVDVDVKGAKTLDLDVGDAGDGPTCDHADWADAAITIQDGRTFRLDDLPRRGRDVRLGSRGSSSNEQLPFFGIETPDNRGVLVGIGWTGHWQAAIGRRGTQLHATAGLVQTSFRLHPGEKVCGPRVLLVFWDGPRLHGQNMLRRTLYEHYVPRLPGGKPHQPLVSVNVCFTYHGHGGYLEQVTEKTVSALVEPFIDLGAETFVIDAGYYKCKNWGEIEATKDYSYCKERFPRGFQSIAQPLKKAGVDFGLWFVPEVFGDLGDPRVREKFLAVLDNYVETQGLTMYRQDGGGTPSGAGPDRLGIPEMQHIAGLYAMQDEIRRRHPLIIMEGCCGGGRRIDLESLSRFHWHQKSDRWFDTVSDHCGLCGANLFLPGGVINVPTEKVDNFGLWSSFGGQLCLAWHPLDKDFPMEKAKRQVQLYKRVRPYLSGDFYPLTECTLEKPWLAYQFHRTDLDAGFALVFKRTAAEGDAFIFAPKGLDPHARYFIDCQASGLKSVQSGVELAKGVGLAIKKTPDAELIIYRRTKGIESRRTSTPFWKSAYGSLPGSPVPAGPSRFAMLSRSLRS